MPKLEERITATQEKLRQLKARQQRIAARQRSLEVRRERQAEIRRKFLVGAVVLARVEDGRFAEAELREWLSEALRGVEDRALFGLGERVGD